MKIAILTLLTLTAAACTDAEMSKFGALGTPGHITCYSGGQVIYEGTSTGKISTEQHSDGWYLKDAKTGKLVRASGDCVIVN